MSKSTSPGVDELLCDFEQHYAKLETERQKRIRIEKLIESIKSNGYNVTGDQIERFWREIWIEQ